MTIPDPESPRRQVTRLSRRKRRSLPAWVFGLPLLAIPILMGLSLLRDEASPVLPTESPILDVQFVTATGQPTPLLPQAYILALSATPTEIPTLIPSSDGDPSGFVTATPFFNVESSQIVFVCYEGGSDEICIMDFNGGNLLRLTEQRGTDWYPSFSPDMKTLIFSTQRSGNFDIFTMDTAGGNLRQLTQRHGENYAPAYSPDGRWVVFTSTFGVGGDQNIWIMAADGTNLTQLTFDQTDEIDPMWSPDGKQISFASNRNGTTELFIMDAAGMSVRQVTRGVNIGGRNDWSPDGKWLTFYAGDAGDKNIFLVDVGCATFSGGCTPNELIQLTDGGNNKGPSFSPDGTWIVYASSIDGDNEIFIMRVDGSDKRQLTDLPRADWQPRWRP